jgi:hypothetical protein
MGLALTMLPLLAQGHLKHRFIPAEAGIHVRSRRKKERKPCQPTLTNPRINQQTQVLSACRFCRDIPSRRGALNGEIPMKRSIFFSLGMISFAVVLKFCGLDSLLYLGLLFYVGPQVGKGMFDYSKRNMSGARFGLLVGMGVVILNLAMWDSQSAVFGNPITNVVVTVVYLAVIFGVLYETRNPSQTA